LWEYTKGLSIKFLAMKFPNGIPWAIAGSGAVILSQSQMAQALSTPQVATIAEQISVRIDGQNPGSGVLLAKQGQTYFVLTAAHVVATEDEYEVVTPDDQRYPLVYGQVKKLPGADLAVVQFNSAKSYPLAKLGDSSQVKRGTAAFVAGWPAIGTAITKPTLLFQQGIVSASSQVQQQDGYGLIYTNNTLPGMSGGPVLNPLGEVIGIHGRGETAREEKTALPDVVVKVGYNLGIPINTFLALAPKAGLSLGLRPTTAPTPPVASASRVDDAIAEGSNKLHRGDYDGALIALNKAIAADPTAADAYRLRADARMSAMGWSFIEGRSIKNRETVLAAQTDIDQAIRLNPQLSDAFAIRAYLRFVLKDEAGALADVTEALRLDPNNAVPYIVRANMLTERRKWRDAIADANQALKLDPNSPYAAFAYLARGLGLVGTRDFSSGLLDLTQSIKLAPSNSLLYLNRGTVRAMMGEKAGAMTDLEKAAGLAVERGNSEVHKETLKVMNLVRSGALGSPCYIATAVLMNQGSEAELDLLRDWRDLVLRQTAIGEHLANYYRQIAPLVAGHVSNNPSLSFSFLYPFVKPAIWLTQQRLIKPQWHWAYDVCLYLIFLSMLAYSSVWHGYYRLRWALT
jgi:tetratricopeptide (TPR) repeat protein